MCTLVMLCCAEAGASHKKQLLHMAKNLTADVNFTAVQLGSQICKHALTSPGATSG